MSRVLEEFGPYQLTRLIGRGGMGEVFEAFDRSQERVVAVKRLVSYLADDAEFQKRFRRESRIAARLRNPHIVPIHRYGEIENQLYIEMRLVDGPNLEVVVDEQHTLDAKRAVNIIEQLASALDAAHKDGLIHRDVKPSNILLDDPGGAEPDFVYLADFGITRAAAGRQSQSLTTSHALIGSLDYMAPEQFDGTAGQAMDIYALGCVFYHCLTGRRPFEFEGLPALMHAHLSLDPPMPSQFRSDLADFDRVVARAMQKKPTDRYPSAGALAADARLALDARLSSANGATPALREITPVRDDPTPSSARPGVIWEEEMHVDAAAPGAADSTAAATSSNVVEPETLDGSTPRGDSEFADAAPSSVGEPRLPVRAAFNGRAAATNHVASKTLTSTPRTKAASTAGDVAADAPPRPPPGSPAPPSPPEGPPPHRDRGDGEAGRSRRRIAALAIAVAAVVVVIALVAIGLIRTFAPPPATAPITAAPPHSIAKSVPVPSLGPTFAAGPTPSFAALSPNGRQLYVAGGDAREVTVVDTSVNTPIATIPIPAGPPRYLAFAADGRRAYVSLFDDARTIAAVAVLDTTTDRVESTIPVRTRPFLPAVTPDERQVWVPNHDSATVSVIDTALARVITEIQVPPNPHWVVFSRDGSRAYTADHESNLVTVLDPRTFAILARIPVPKSPHSLALHPTKPILANVGYDANMLTFIDTTDNSVVGTVSVGMNPRDVAWAPDGRFVYVVNETSRTLSVIDGQTMRVTATLPTPPGPNSIAVTPDGRTGYIACTGGNVIATVALSA